MDFGKPYQFYISVHYFNFSASWRFMFVTIDGSSVDPQHYIIITLSAVWAISIVTHEAQNTKSNAALRCNTLHLFNLTTLTILESDDRTWKCLKTENPHQSERRCTIYFVKGYKLSYILCDATTAQCIPCRLSRLFMLISSTSSLRALSFVASKPFIQSFWLAVEDRTLLIIGGQ